MNICVQTTTGVSYPDHEWDVNNPVCSRCGQEMSDEEFDPNVRDGTKAALISDLQKRSRGMEIDWNHDVGNILVMLPMWDADTQDFEIRDEIESLADGQDDEDKEEAVEYWIGARDAARNQRRMVKDVLSCLETDDLEGAERIATDLASSEREYGDAPYYGEFPGRIEDLRNMYST